VTTALIAASGGVASGHPLASRAGVDALDAGGSSVDAVLAMAFAQWTVSGPLCGPGGDLFVLHVDDDRATVYGGWSRTPGAYPVEGPVKASGPTGAVVPGALAGAGAAWRAAGNLPWARLFDAAIGLSAGHEVTPFMARSYASVIDRGHGEAMHRFLDGADLPPAGATVSCERFGRTLRRLATGGAHEIYRGSLAADLVAAAAADGAFLQMDDLEAMEPVVGPAPVHDLGDITVVVPPPPSQAGITPRLLAAASPDVAADSRSFVEAVALTTQTELTARCVTGVPGTAACVATDGQTAAVLVHSLAGVQFGTGWVAGDTAIALGNRVGTALSTRADLPAANPVPGEVLPHTLSAAWFKSRDRWVLVATPGGDRQVQWLAQAGQRFRRGEPLEAVVGGPRWFVCPEGDRFGVPGGIGREWFLFAEPDVPWAQDDNVAGYAVRQTTSIGGGLQGIERGPDGWRIASDPRGGGAALAQGAHDV
jgi:gamma-glutamyltranspeptidase/glutathione hydrolase